MRSTAAQALINDCRKSGDLPLNICSEDDKRAADNLEDIDADPPERAVEIFNYIRTAENYYTPFSFWDDLDVYVQVATEKSNIEISSKSLVPSSACRSPTPAGGAILMCAPASCSASRKRRPRASSACCCLSPILIPADCKSRTMRANLEAMAHAVGRAPDNLIIERFGLD